MAARLCRCSVCCGFGSKATVHNSCRFRVSGAPKYLQRFFKFLLKVLTYLRHFFPIFCHYKCFICGSTFHRVGGWEQVERDEIRRVCESGVRDLSQGPRRHGGSRPKGFCQPPPLEGFSTTGPSVRVLLCESWISNIS